MKNDMIDDSKVIQCDEEHLMIEEKQEKIER